MFNPSLILVSLQLPFIVGNICTTNLNQNIMHQFCCYYFSSPKLLKATVVGTGTDMSCTNTLLMGTGGEAPEV